MKPILCVLALLAIAPQPDAVAQESQQQILRSRYRLVGSDGPLGYTELTEFRRADGSRSYLARERMEFWGPVLDRFILLTFDSDGHFDSGHWVATAEYQPAFSYSFRHDGSSIRGEWEGTVVGHGTADVPASPDAPLIGFWGPLESLVLRAFDEDGERRQIIESIDVEDTHHRQLAITVEHIGKEHIQVPAGEFEADLFHTQRFGMTRHWLDAEGVPLVWESENGTYRWELERYPTEEALARTTTPVASGAYEVSSMGEGLGEIRWSIGREAGRDGDLILTASSTVPARTALEGRLSDALEWKSSTETSVFGQGEGGGLFEIHHLDTFFLRDRMYLVRSRDRAHPLLQTTDVAAPAAFHVVDYPVTAAFWLANVDRAVMGEQELRLTHITNRYRGSVLKAQTAHASYLGIEELEGPLGSGPAHRYSVRYPGGWDDSTFDYWTDEWLVPLKVVMKVGANPVEFRLTEYEVSDHDALMPR